MAHINKELESVARKFSPLDTLSEQHLSDLIQSATMRDLPAQRVLFKRGELSPKLVFLLEGQVDLCDQHFKIRNIEAGTPTARFSLERVSPHQCTAISTTPVRVLELDSDQVDLAVTWSQATTYVVEEISNDLAHENDGDWIASLLRSHLMQNVPPSHLQQLFSSFERRDVRTNQVIIQQGEDGDHFFVIQRGLAIVMRTDATGVERELARLGSGDFFGEDALISDTVRNATVRMTSDGVLMALNKASFRRLLKDPVIEYVTPKQLSTFKNRHQILDVRLESELTPNEAMPNLHIPLSELRQRAAELDAALTYVVHQNAGRRAELGAYLLQEAGLQAVVLKSSA
ncbi:MAG: cyclic nucleotide-binding domain-containing protein [Pseudomonadota bacterium]